MAGNHTLLLAAAVIVGLFFLARARRKPERRGVIVVTRAGPSRPRAGPFVWIVVAIGAFIVWKLFQTP